MIGLVYLTGKMYFSSMNAETKMSAKGQVVIPKHLRDRLDWVTGTELEIEESADGVLLRTKRDPRRRITVEEFERLRPKYDGPVISIEEMNQAILDEAARRWRKKERRSR
jgi:AbrB family looped-hinge helix DNA binding protein